jgi:hypothetical protein
MKFGAVRAVTGVMISLTVTQMTVEAQKGGGDKAAVMAAVKKFEEAYKRKDANMMITKLMAPTQDKVKIQQRGEWLKGNGPGDAPNTAPPLFKSNRGSFVPSKYVISSATPQSKDKWQVVVKEDGTYKDEDGKYKVSRTRHVTVTKAGGKWLIADYVMKENPTNYGFFVDDISDKMTPIGQ